MADETTTPETSATEQGTEVTAEQKAAPEIPKEVSAALKKANKEAETLRLKLKEFEDRDKTELEKLAERASAAEKAATEHQRELLRLRVGAAKGLTPDLVERLRGETAEELEADAETLLSLMKGTEPTRRTTDLKQGPRGSVPAANENDLFRRFLGSR